MTTPSVNRASFFVDNDDGTVTDTRTDLMWMRSALGQTWDGETSAGDSNSYSWEDAIHISHQFAGYDDWRLPDLDELRSITLQSRSRPSIDIDAFPNTPIKEFWTSRKLIEYRYAINFLDGGSPPKLVSARLSVRLVRGIKFDNTLRLQFIDNGDGTITDSRSGLTWMRCAMGQAWDGINCVGKPKVYQWSMAMQIRHRFAKYDDWRLPDIEELNSIVDPASCGTITGENAFPNMHDGNFWSTSTYRDSAAWNNMFRGSSCRPFPTPKSSELNVRLVRGGQPFISRNSEGKVILDTTGHDVVELIETIATQTDVTMLQVLNEPKSPEVRPTLDLNKPSEITELHGKLTVIAAIELLKNSPELFSSEIAQLRAMFLNDAMSPNSGALDPPYLLQSLAEVTGWLTTKNSISIASLRKILLPLDLLPSAVIDEINERALDLTGEQALEENGDEIVITKNILTEVLAAWEPIITIESESDQS